MFPFTFGTATVRRLGCALLAAIAAISVTTPASLGQVCEELQKIIASDPHTSQVFGRVVAASGSTLVVGADSDVAGGLGAVYVFALSGLPGNEQWIEQAKLTPPDSAVVFQFGMSVAVSGDTIVVGSQSSSGEENFGSAFVFVRTGAPGSEVWTLQAELTSTVEADDFGKHVAVAGDTAMVGAIEDNEERGAVYIFSRSGTTWTQQAVLSAPDGDPGDHFGNAGAFAATGDTAVITAISDNHEGTEDEGSAYVFVRSGPPEKPVWTQQAKLIPDDVEEIGLFGWSIAIVDDTVLIGAHTGNFSQINTKGSAFVFTRSGLPGSEVWVQTAKLTASDAASGDIFGDSVALSGDSALIGAPFDDEAIGAVYKFTRSGPPGGEVWSETSKLTASDADTHTVFGESVAILGNLCVVGSSGDDHSGFENPGSAYIIACCPVDIAASDAAENDEFGIAVAIDGDTAIVGARLDDNATGVDAGAAYVYIRSGPPGSELWTEQAKLIGNEPLFGLETGNQSGIAVDVSGDTALVGSWLWPNGNATGLVYIFGRSGPPGSEVWTQQFAVACPQFGSFQYFGYSLALEGDTALVGSLAATGLNVGGQVFFGARSGPPGAQSWTFNQKFPSDGVPGDQFGHSVALSPSQDTAVVGALLEDNAGGNDAGSAYVYIRSGNAWIEQAKLTASDGAAEDRFGINVAISGDTAVVGAYWDDHDAGANAGSAYVFTRSGTRWTEQAKLTASDAAAGDEFGVRVSFAGDTLVVGSFLDDNAGGTDAGSAYVFTRNGTVWTEQYKLTAPNGSETDWFGASVSLDGDTPMIGARQDDNFGGINAGSAYVFDCLDLSPTVPACPADIAPAPTGDGSVNVDDLLAVINGWGSCTDPDNCPADIAPDGGDDAVNVDDLLAIINAWGACQ